MIALWATVIAALIAAVVAPWAKARIDRRNEKADEDRADKATIATLVDKQVDRMFREQEAMRKAYREDLADARAQTRDLAGRVELLEREVAEWRSGLHGVVGVWVAVPSHIWEMVREALPDLPPTRFPGERGAVEGRND